MKLSASIKSSDDGRQKWYLCKVYEKGESKSLTMPKMVVGGGRNREKTDGKKKRRKRKGEVVV